MPFQQGSRVITSPSKPGQGLTRKSRVYKMKKPGLKNHANHDRKNGQLFLFGNHANGSITL
jgi:hypothetical protein